MVLGGGEVSYERGTPVPRPDRGASLRTFGTDTVGPGPETRNAKPKYETEMRNLKSQNHEPSPQAVIPASFTLKSRPEAIHPKPQTHKHKPRTLHLNPYTLHPKPCTLNPNHCTLRPKPSTLNPQPSTLNPQPSTLNTQPSTLNPQHSTPTRK